jgi:hypothetical protein
MKVNLTGILTKKGVDNTDDGAIGWVKIQYPVNGRFDREGEITRLLGATVNVQIEDPQLKLYLEEKQKSEKAAAPPNVNPETGEEVDPEVEELLSHTAAAVVKKSAEEKSAKKNEKKH